MKKRKFNIWGFIAICVWLFSIGFMIYDFIQLTKGATYTWFGVSILGAVLFSGCIAEDYINERLHR